MAATLPGRKPTPCTDQEGEEAQKSPKPNNKRNGWMKIDSEPIRQELRESRRQMSNVRSCPAQEFLQRTEDL
ncbi:hypothetical protein PDE_09621 [Penicillium oxalicum 114-2]|uniref:Uncharacterized protein n=1 Tax=Penicillium oxalicum (strain 114-2 / CGMCC 5302) TaxID=933388 RepID=S8BHJ3_PENO1|nr:hypothetical protein PDE_09621 [Penicillium oxalicum 114-2]